MAPDAKVLQNTTVSGGDVTADSDEVTTHSHSRDGIYALAHKYQRYTANCITDKNVIKHTSKPLQWDRFLQCNLSPQSIETTDKTGLIYFSE